MLIIKLLIIAICAILNWIGGQFWHNARRFIIPPVLAISVSLFTHIWWLGITVLPVIGVFCIGYGDKTILYKYLSDAGARGMWMFLSALVIGMGCFISHHLFWYAYIPYCIIAGILGATLRNIFEVIGDLIFGAFLASIVLLVR